MDTQKSYLLGATLSYRSVNAFVMFQNAAWRWDKSLRVHLEAIELLQSFFAPQPIGCNMLQFTYVQT